MVSRAGDSAVMSVVIRPPVVLRPAGPFEIISLSEAWYYRHVFSVFLWRNIIRRYRQTLFGPFWFILGPIVRMCAFAFVLGGIAGLPSDDVPYPIFTYSALLPWELFASGVVRSTESLVSYEHIISKVYFPRVFVPATEAAGGLVDFGISFVVLLALMVAYGFPLTPRLVIVPLLVLITVALALGIGLMFAAMQVRYRDTASLVSYGLQFWFFATPVAYSATVLTNHLPLAAEWLYRLNPMTVVVQAFRWAILGTGEIPDASLVATAGSAVVCLVFGAAVFGRTEHSIVDLV